MNTLQFAFRPFLPLMNEVFERQSPLTEVTYKPAANVRENDKQYVIELALPGFAKDEINLNFEDEVLTITAGLVAKKEETTGKYTWNEFGYKAKYERSFQLPETVEADSIVASYENGILIVTLPKKEAQPSSAKKIEIA